MKKIINKILMLTTIVSAISFSFGTVLAQSYDDVGSFSGETSVGSDQVSNGWYESFNPNTPASYDNVSNFYYPDAATYSGNQTCVGCGTSASNVSSDVTPNGWYESFNPNTPASYDNVSNFYYPDAATYSGNQTCVGCNAGSQYVSPTYSNSNLQHVSPTYSNPNSQYVSPRYGNGSSYTSPSYVYSNPTPNYTYPSYTYSTQNNTNTIVCSNGNLPVNGSCQSISVIPVTTITHCSDGALPVNGLCSHSLTIPSTYSTYCSDGSFPTNGSCNRTSTLPITNTIVCSDGTLPVNGTCNRVITYPVTIVNNCPSNTNFVNGTCQQIVNPPVAIFQTCWNGEVIPATSVCQPQYKVCANGTSVPANQACYVPPTPVYIPPVVIKFNNVVTSVATQITNTSGRCNGIGLIANNAPSTGWFEYGETSNLGRTTASAAIGYQDTSSFSNVLANLKPSTRYFCRAVMQNQYGLVKGEIVSFTTKSVVTKYIKPVVKPTVHRTPVKSNVVTCSDGSTLPIKSMGAATLINQGEKLLTVQIEKADGTLSSEGTVHYKVMYKNIVDSRLTGVVIKVVLPQEMMLVSTNIGTFDAGTRTLTLNQDTVDPYTEGSILITGTIIKDAPLGKTIITTVYAVYTVPGTKTQDEVTAYVVGSIVPTVDTTHKDTGAKKVIGATDGKGFMPNSLIEWLALLAILFIIFILGRSIYASYKEDEGTKSH